MQIDSAKLDSIQAAIKAVLDPPKAVSMGPEEFLKYVGEQVAALVKDTPEIAQKRAQSLDLAFTAMKAASEAKLEKGDVVLFEEPVAPVAEPAPAVPPVAEIAAAPEPAAPITEPAPEPAAKRFCWPTDLADPKAREQIRNAGK